MANFRNQEDQLDLRYSTWRHLSSRFHFNSKMESSRTEEDNLKLQLLTRRPTHSPYTIAVTEYVANPYRLSNDGKRFDIWKTRNNNNAQATLDAGYLSRLPPEILLSILENFLDIKSLLKLKSVSRYMKQVIEQSVPSYHRVATYVPDALAALVMTGLAPQFTIKVLDNALCSTQCANCGNLGGSLYLLKCKRACIICLGAQDWEFKPLTREMARQTYRLDQKSVKGLPTLKTPSSMYEAYMLFKRNFYFVDQAAAYEAGVKLHGGQLERVEAPITNNGTPWKCTMCFPSFDRQRQVLERYVCCRYFCDREMSPSTFLREHFPNCERAKLIWVDDSE